MAKYLIAYNFLKPVEIFPAYSRSLFFTVKQNKGKDEKLNIFKNFMNFNLTLGQKH